MVLSKVTADQVRYSEGKKKGKREIWRVASSYQLRLLAICNHILTSDFSSSSFFFSVRSIDYLRAFFLCNFRDSLLRTIAEIRNASGRLRS